MALIRSRPQRTMALACGAADGEAGGGRSPIDPGAIARLRELDPGGEHGVVDRVLRAYQATLERHLREIESAWASGDGQALMRTSHTLKSSSGAVGALDLSRRCGAIEHVLRSGGPLPDAAEVEALIHEGRSVLASVAAMLPGRCGHAT